MIAKGVAKSQMHWSTRSDLQDYMVKGTYMLFYYSRPSKFHSVSL